VLNMGRKQRLFKGPLRDAVLMHSRWCTWPGCNRPAEQCEADHVLMLEGGDYAQVVIRVRPGDVASVSPQLVDLRDGYERLFVDLVAALPVQRGTDRRSLRLVTLSMNPMLSSS